jgi:hypothetical protein
LPSLQLVPLAFGCLVQVPEEHTPVLQASVNPAHSAEVQHDDVGIHAFPHFL